jgi:hypothetical protein
MISLVNGYVCLNCGDVALAKHDINPAKSADNPASPAYDPAQARADHGPAVTFCGSLSGAGGSQQARPTSVPPASTPASGTSGASAGRLDISI